MLPQGSPSEVFIVTAKFAGLLFIGRLFAIAVGIGFLLTEVLGMCGAVAITAGFLLTTGFHT